MVMLTDKVTLSGKPVRTADGYAKVRARAARVGVYQYLGAEVDPKGKHFAADAVVNVYRSPEQVFDAAAVKSFAFKPITDNHPSEPVTADNWRDHSGGAIVGAVRDGDFLAFDLAMMDAGLIKGLTNKRELSAGYTCDIEFKNGAAPDGTAYQAVQTNIRGNHLAVVDRGRAGSECAIANDRFALCDSNPAAVPEPKGETMKITIDGLPVDLSDADAVKAVIAKKDAAIADEKARADTLAGEKAALEKQLADAKAAADPAALDKRVADRAKLVADAKAIKSDIVTDGKTDADIRKEVVTAELGDGLTLSDEGVAGAFAALVKGKAANDSAVQPIGAPQVLQDAAALEDAAWRASCDFNSWREKRA